MSIGSKTKTIEKDKSVVLVRALTVRFGVCLSCGAHLRWFMTARGKWMPVNCGYTVRAIRKMTIENETIWIGEIARTFVHWSTCSEPERWRRTRTRARR